MALIRYEKTPSRTIRGSLRRGAGVLIAVAPMNSSKTKWKPNEVGSILKGGARERADGVFFAVGIKDVGAKRTLLRRGTGDGA